MMCIQSVCMYVCMYVWHANVHTYMCVCSLISNEFHGVT